ncbi:glycosyltransferase family 4 protein [Haloarcula sp. CBA1130]|uniref:glycosyltransferase family 4 protein n=1 Tax=unclassified Haloarcula TaxID=2624677 RepID=UPI001244F8BE|nr:MULTISPECIES: glycosyltransferase family 4 protein [unclassified Haloarcula]KAA9396485.1 glycosyltransferase family 4 protein [Haloarcula sp. CBA1130]KAA9397658.1 glycosyltransferase family 4 protein [Haloarcula sp. CBA1129]
MSDPYDVLACSIHHQSHPLQVRSPFNHRSFDAINRTHADLDVVVPTPYAPPVGPHSEYAKVPKTERWGTYVAHYPRFLYAIPKRYFYHVSGDSLQKRIPRYVERTFETPHDVVHTSDIYLDGYGLLPYCREHDVPLVVNSHAVDLHNFDSFNDSTQQRIRETIDYAARILTVSDELAGVARRFAPAGKVQTVPIGADPEMFPTDRREKIRRELGIGPETKVLLYVGAYTEQKGVKELVAAVDALDREDVMLVTVGHEGDLRWWLLDQLGKLSHPAKSLWRLDPLALRRWQVAADAVVHPSWTEGRPTVVYEAMAAGTPVVASRVGGIPEMVVDGETGVLVPPKDPVTLTAALDSLLDDPERLRAMGTAGHQRLLDQQWTWGHHADRVTEIHEAVMAQW